jgi:hypothetical protein
MTSEEKRVLASEILSYLLKNPEAGDTLEGIARFWTSPQSSGDAVHEVQAVLADLVRQGIVTTRMLKERGKLNTQSYYQLNPARLKEIKTMLKREPRGR